MPDEPSAAVEIAEAPPAPRMLAVGGPYTSHGGLELTVLAVEKPPVAATAQGTSARVIVRVRVRNAEAEPREFANDFGILDHAGAVHRHTWANPARFPGALPGVATLAPGETIEGEVHVLVPDAHEVPTAALRAAVLTLVTGCGACDHEVTLFPAVIWQEA